MVTPERRKQYRIKYKANQTEASKELERESKRRWRRKNKEKQNALSRAWEQKNRERANATCRKSYAKNAEKRRAEMSARAKANRAPQLESNARRRAAKLSGTPVWANKFYMQEIYHLARLRTKHLGIPHHVDHIVPLKSPLVCGLHCEQNMRVIPSALNIGKGNRHWPDMP